MTQPPLFGYQRGIHSTKESSTIDDMFDIFFHDGAFDDEFGAFEGGEDFLGENEGNDYDDHDNNEREERGHKSSSSKSDVDKSERR